MLLSSYDLEYFTFTVNWDKVCWSKEGCALRWHLLWSSPQKCHDATPRLSPEGRPSQHCGQGQQPTQPGGQDPGSLPSLRLHSLPLQPSLLLHQHRADPGPALLPSGPPPWSPQLPQFSVRRNGLQSPAQPQPVQPQSQEPHPRFHLHRALQGQLQWGRSSN